MQVSFVHKDFLTLHRDDPVITDLIYNQVCLIV